MARDRQKRKESRRRYREKNKEKLNALKREYRKKNHAMVTGHEQKYYRKHREKIFEKHRRRRSKQKNCFISLTTKEKHEMLLMEFTRKELQNETGHVYHLDHILPLACGGVHHPSNLRIMEGSKNSSKRDIIIPEAIPLIPKQYALYYERSGPERAYEFIEKIAMHLGNQFGIQSIKNMLKENSIKPKPTLEDFLL